MTVLSLSVIASCVLLGTGIAAAVVLRNRLLVVTVHGASMEPTLRDGNRVLVWRTQQLGTGDLAVFTPPQPVQAGDPPLRIKRVMATSGEQIPEWTAGTRRGILPAGLLVVRGDAHRSEDSRAWGPIPDRLVVGKVVRTI